MRDWGYGSVGQCLYPRSSGSVSSTSHTRRSWNVHVMDQVVGMAANGTSVRAPFSVSRRSLTLLFHASSEFAATVNPGTSVLWYASKVCLFSMCSALFLQWRWKRQLLNSTSQSWNWKSLISCWSHCLAIQWEALVVDTTLNDKWLLI